MRIIYITITIKKTAFPRKTHCHVWQILVIKKIRNIYNTNRIIIITLFFIYYVSCNNFLWYWSMKNVVLWRCKARNDRLTAEKSREINVRHPAHTFVSKINTMYSVQDVSASLLHQDFMCSQILTYIIWTTNNSGFWLQNNVWLFILLSCWILRDFFHISILQIHFLQFN